MYRNKKDVDKHVEGLIAKLSLKEFKSRAYSVARLYFDVGDYTSCQRYVEQYLTHKCNNAEAHKLLGQALLKLGQKEKALEQYKMSLEINPIQTTMIVDICELLSDDEVFIDPGRAKYWCEKAEATFPRHPATFRLRERLMKLSNPDPEALVSLLKAEIGVRPKDVTLHSRLIKHHLDSNNIKEAFDHACNVEFGSNTFINNTVWYEKILEIVKKTSHDTKRDWLSQLLNLTVWERLCFLSLAETPSGTSKSLVESTELLHLYDQCIQEISKSGAPSGFAEFHAALLHHHRGQFALHAATLLLKKAKKDQMNWRDAMKSAAPLMLIAWHAVPSDSKASWVSVAPEKLKTAVHRWFIEGSYRCSQAGHYLLANVQDKSQAFLDQVTQCCSGSHWRDKLFDKIFPGREYTQSREKSHLASNAFGSPILRLPRRIEIEAYDANAQRQHPNSLHHFAWMVMNYKNFAHFECSLFDMMKPTSRNHMNSGPETLNKYDIFAFLYSAALTAQQQRANKNSYDSGLKPTLLPANITELLCPLNQMKWWDCAYKFSQNQLGTDLTDIRATLSRGIEVIRCVDNHGLDAELLCILGRAFSDRAKGTTSVDEKNNLEIRAGLYYNAAIPLLEKIKSKLKVNVPDRRLFDYTHKELSNKDLNAYIEESKIYVAVNHLNESEYEKALDLLTNLKSPQALYHLSQTYKKMALEEQNASKDLTNGDSKSKTATFLSKAKILAYKCLDRLKDLQEDVKNPLFSDVQEFIEDIGMHINKFDPDLTGTIQNEIDAKYSSDDNISSAGSENVMHTNPHVFRNVSSTPKHSATVNASNYRTAADSQLFDLTRNDHKYLERIENEMKNLQKRDATIGTFMDQTKDWFEENRNLGNRIMNTINTNMQNTTDQFENLQTSVDQVKVQIEKCRNDCKDVGQLKEQVAELVKEVNKLKKASSENVDESNLYDFRANEGASNLAAQFTSPQVLPPFNQRLVPPFPVTPNPYHMSGQNLYNLYNQYAQFTQTGAVPGAHSLFDAAARQAGFPGMYATPEQLNVYPDVAHLLAANAVVPPVPTMPTMPTVPHLPATVPPPAPAPVSAHKPPSSLKDTLRSLPVNVVITSSDPLPTCTTAPQPILSVTIPPKHIKGTPHNYQIQLPPSNENQVMPPIMSTSAIGSTVNSSTMSKPFASWSQFMTSSSGMAPTANLSTDKHAFSFIDSPKNVFDNSVSVVDGANNYSTSLNKSRTLSERSNTSVDNYDPCPDFKPIVPLPDEIKVTTGEEDESTVFNARAKLFRFDNKEWKERGIGEMKLLKHKETGKVRVLMRREQVHKICANHIIKPDMDIQPMKNELKAYFWVANDFADEKVVLEKFCVRFKTPEIGKQFYDAFENARQASSTSITYCKPESPVGKSVLEQYLSTPEKETEAKQLVTQANKTVVGGFTFSSTPTFKPTKEEDAPETKKPETPSTKANLFGNLSFKTNTSSPFSNLFNVSSTQSNDVAASSPAQKGESPAKLNTSDTVEEFEPTIEFKPVVPLPALVDHKTGEEQENILFEHRAKLLRFDAAAKEWKERGLGNIKLLAHRESPQKIRILMRREQVMKVCCNHSLTKELVFGKMPNMDKAVTWCAKDFSEGELVTETFCLRFKTVQVCDDFMAAVKNAQNSLNDVSKTIKEEQNAVTQSSMGGFGDQFKPKTGSWHCESCYTNNLESFLKCACCEQPKPQSKKAASAPAAVNPAAAPGWGDKFKPKVGSWECKECLIRNEGNLQYCGACNSPKDPTMPKKDVKPAVESTVKFSFGIPSQTAKTIQPVKAETSQTATSGWGDKFKPKEGSWECKECFVRNDATLDECSACNSPKDPNAVKKESKSIFGLPSSGPKFSFGIPAATTAVDNQASIFDGTGGQKFSFGIPQNTPDKAQAQSIFEVQTPVGSTGVIFATPKKPDQQVTPLNFAMKKNDDLSVTLTPVKPALLPTPTAPKDAAFGAKECSTFDFVFKPKTPVKGKSPVKSPHGAEESDDNEYASEDEGHHIHFSPIVPLPDKIEVVTGEESEDELYGHRAKLFRFTSGEWKERGIGVVKILKHKETGKLRVVMRREQVLKICLNHALTSDIQYNAKDDKTWLFAANDFSEGELSIQQFCLRFKTKEIAEAFKNAIDKTRDGKTIPAAKFDGDSDDVVFVQEILAPKAEQELAKNLMLPENFFNYKTKPPCRGCRGCKEDDDVAPALDAALSTPKKSNSPSRQFSPATSVYGTPANFNKTLDTSIFQTPFESTPMFGANNRTDGNDKENFFLPKSNIFGVTVVPETVTAATPIPTSTNTSIFAPPKLNTVITPKANENQSSDAKSIFSAAQNQPFFGNANTTSLFGNKNNETGSIFGKPSNNESTSIFGGAGKTETKSLFGGAANDSGSIFGGSCTFSKPLFGNKEDSTAKPEVKSIFGADSEKPASVFGSAVSGNVFGAAALQNPNKPAGGLFGAGSGSLFGANATPVFGGAADKLANWTFGQDNADKSKETITSSVFGNKADAVKAEGAAEMEPVFKVDNGLSFDALASSEPGFSIKTNTNFQWEGAGQQLFGKKADTSGRDASGAGEEGAAAAAAGGDEEYDPHYEPIVPLPDKIVVTTGEEDEEKLYGERCKLYRYDDKTKEWKERGVGEIKLLHHAQRNTYRLLLRREQVHKAVLNSLLFTDMELLPLKSSDKSWTWAAINYAEEPAGEQETLALRFKSADLAAAFKAKVDESIRKVQAAAAQAVREEKEAPRVQETPLMRLPKHLAEGARADPAMSAQAGLFSFAPKDTTQSMFSFARPGGTTNGNERSEAKPHVTFHEPAAQAEHDEHADDEEHADEDEEYEHNYDDYEDYEEEDSPSLFVCGGAVAVSGGGARATCDDAQLQVMYDQELYSPKILVTDAGTGEILADMLIHTDTEFQMSGDTCTWTGTDYTSDAVDKTVTVNFADSETAMQFYDSCETSKAATYSSES